jgi:hypothetical protein
MKSRSKLILGIVYPRLDIANKLLSTVMDKDNTLTDKEYNFIREAHDYISNARDMLEILTKQD